VRASAVITGATSGIGKSYAYAFAARGYDLLLTGRREEKLRGLCEELAANRGVRAEYRIVELTDRAALSGLAGEVQELPAPAVLVNNAGFGRTAAFHEDHIEGQAGMVTVHVEATLRLSHAVIPRMKQRGRGWIINVSSLASYLPLPRGGVYSSTKAWVVSFTESLALELRPYGIRCQALLPGFTHTDFHRGPEYSKLDRRSRGLIRWMEPERVVEISLQSIERGRRVVCVPGAANRLNAFVVRHMPRALLQRMVASIRFTNTDRPGGADR
jgi:hypothetical protein